MASGMADADMIESWFSSTKSKPRERLFMSDSLVMARIL